MSPTEGERRRGRIRRGLDHFWSDLKASADPSLLSVPRFLGLLYGRIDRALPIDQAFRKMLRYRLPAHVGWRHALGGVTYLLFIVLVVTGVLLTLYYRPTADEAYASVQVIASQRPMGWLIRNVHVSAANLIVLALLAHMARVFFAGAYKPPRGTSWFVGLLLLVVVLAFGASGTLLPWDQWAYWTVTGSLQALRAIPLIGGPGARVLVGGDVVTGGTLGRFFTLHAILLPWMAFTLVLLHFAVVRRLGISGPKGEATSDRGVPFYPNHLLRTFIVSVLVIAVTVSLAVLFPRLVSDPADPLRPPAEIESTWIMVDVSLGLMRYLGGAGITLFLVLALGVALLPLFDRGPETALRRRPVAAVVGLVFFLGFLLAWLVGQQFPYQPTTATMRGGDVDAVASPVDAGPAASEPEVEELQPVVDPSGTGGD